MEFWAGHLVAGRPTECDRDAEFVATGEVSTLVERVQRAREQLRADLATLDPAAHCATRPIPRTRTCRSDARKAPRSCTCTASSRRTSARWRAAATC